MSRLLCLISTLVIAGCTNNPSGVSHFNEADVGANPASPSEIILASAAISLGTGGTGGSGASGVGGGGGAAQVGSQPSSTPLGGTGGAGAGSEGAGGGGSEVGQDPPAAPGGPSSDAGATQL
jgi:hypothetical protein